MAALCDDLNTPVAISVLHELLSAFNKTPTAETKGALLAAAKLLGVLEQDPEAWFTQGRGEKAGLDSDVIDGLIAERAQAKIDKNYARADEIRTELDAQGVILEDSPQGTTWKRK